MLKNNRGITLIALVVTVIVLLILAGVSINMLTGQNGILNRASEAKENTQIATEREALGFNIMQVNMKENISSNESYRIGKKLYTKNFENSDKWDYIYLEETSKAYGDDWYYINKNTDIGNYGKTKKEWLINYENGEIIELKEGKYTEVSANNIIITDGLVFNLDSNDFSISDKQTWGNNLEAFGFDEEQEITNSINFDGIDDYIAFKSGTNFENGFTISFYGKASDSYFFSKQKENNFAYSCRFGMSEKMFYFNTSKNQANSTWSDDVQGGNNNGNLLVRCDYTMGEDGYFDLTFDPNENIFILYDKGQEVARTTTDYNYVSVKF